MMARDMIFLVVLGLLCLFLCFEAYIYFLFIMFKRFFPLLKLSFLLRIVIFVNFLFAACFCKDD